MRYGRGRRPVSITIIPTTVNTQPATRGVVSGSLNSITPAAAQIAFCEALTTFVNVTEIRFNDPATAKNARAFIQPAAMMAHHSFAVVAEIRSMPG